MRHVRTSLAIILLACAALAACGGPSAPSDAGVVLQGQVVGATASTSATAARAGASRAAAGITVTVVEDPRITSTVGPDGTFTLRGLPEGAFTLRFTSGAATLGTVILDGVKPNQEITITIRVDPTGITILDQRRDGIGHGDVEIEGVVAEVLELDPAGESRLLVKGRVVVVRVGETAIREGGRGRSVEDVTEGRRIHVKGVFLAPEDGREVVLAREIKLQGGAQEDDGDGDEDDRTCAVAGARVGSGIELEGAVSTGAGAAFVMRVQGNRASVAVDVDASGAEFKCNGPGSPTAAECRAQLGPGVRVHVSGTVQACDTTSAAVRAARVMVKK